MDIFERSTHLMIGVGAGAMLGNDARVMLMEGKTDVEVRFPRVLASRSQAESPQGLRESVGVPKRRIDQKYGNHVQPSYGILRTQLRRRHSAPPLGNILEHMITSPFSTRSP